MELVIDANIVMSVLIAPQATTAELLFSDELTLYVPEYLLDEFEKHKEEILEKSELNETDFDLFLSLVSSRINFVPFDEFRFFIEKAKDISPDQNDTEYFCSSIEAELCIMDE